MKKSLFVITLLIISTVCLSQIVEREEFGETRVYKDGELIRIIRQDPVASERKNIFAADGVTRLGFQQQDITKERVNIYNANHEKIAFQEQDLMDKNRINVYDADRKKLGHYEWRISRWEFFPE